MYIHTYVCVFVSINTYIYTYIYIDFICRILFSFKTEHPIVTSPVLYGKMERTRVLKVDT